MEYFKTLATVAALVFGISTETYALVQNNTAVVMTGTEGHGKQVYVGIDPNPNNCKYSGVYFIDAAELTQVLSVALSSKMAGKKIRIDYTQPDGAGTQCFGYSIYAQ